MAASPYKRILITGAHGFMGQNVSHAFREHTDAEIIDVGHSDYDLMKLDAAEAMLKDTKPDAVIHLAGKIGGIIANRKYPANFFHENTTINMNTFEAAHRAKIGKFITLIGGCSYPAAATSPIDEGQMWDGFPQIDSAFYAASKRLILMQSLAYRQQHGFNSVPLIAGNVYGEYDNFDEEYSHVIPALIRRFLEAKDENLPQVTCYGSGKPTRDFVYAGDVAKAMVWFLDNYDKSETVNISSGTRTSIKELAETVRELTGYKGELVWDTSMPDGQLDKIFDVERMHGLGIRCDTTLSEGLGKTIAWFDNARAKGMARL